MLKFFRKTGQKEQSSSSLSSLANSPPITPTETNYDNKNVVNHFRKGPLASFDDEGLFDIGEAEAPKERSRLSKTLGEVLVDKAALGYFIQYLESRNALQYVQCWLDIDHFQTAIQCVDDSRLLSTKIDHDSLSVSTDCDSYTADSVSLYDYSDKQNDNIKTPDKNNLINNCDKDSSETNPKVNEIYMQEFTDDALRIFKKFIALEAPENINCSEDVRKEIIENICNSDKMLSSDCFKKAQDFVYSILDKEYFEVFLGSDYFCKHQIDVLTSGNVVLEDILYNETALFYFMEFLEQENNRSLLEFWLASNNLHQQLHDQKDFFDPIEAQNDAVVLYDKYFSLQAHCPLGFGDKVRFAVEQNICGENGLMHDCFHLPLKIIEQVLERNYLKSFLASQLFYKYLSELINTVQSSGYCIYDKNKYLASDCSSEKSFTNNSTFLAMENPNKNNKKKDKGTDMNIDTRQLYDPDSLWKRKKYHRLSFGRVTELGQFITDFEPEPDKRGQSVIKSVVKKFVNLEEHKKREELAWQVAEMIVKDITSVTLNDQKS